jgi:prepilin-type N-terminal cleavage/methylation domain-containing protein
MERKLLRTKKGFTIIELLIVVAIIGILAAIGILTYNNYTTIAKIKATETKHKMIVKEVTLGFTKCSDRTSTWKIQGAPNYYPSYSCDYIMEDLNRFLNMLQYHFQWVHPVNPYLPNSHKSYSVSRSSSKCQQQNRIELGKTCINNSGNIVKILTNIGDTEGNNFYISNEIITE